MNLETGEYLGAPYWKWLALIFFVVFGSFLLVFLWTIDPLTYKARVRMVMYGLLLPVERDS